MVTGLRSVAAPEPAERTDFPRLDAHRHRRGYMVLNPAAQVEFPRRENRLPRVILTSRETQRLLEAPDAKSPGSLRDRAILETFYATGIRASELAYLTPDDVDTEQLLFVCSQ